MSSKPFSAAEEDAIIRERFLSGASTGRGKPPFSQLARRFVDLVAKAEGGTNSAAEDALRLFLREATVIEQQAQKLRAVCQAQTKEQESYVRKQEALHAQIEQAKRDIESKKDELREARVARQHMEEYEVLRGMVAELPSRAATQAEIDRVDRQVERIQKEGVKYAAAMERKRKQYALLFLVLEELQRVGDDPADAAEPEQAELGTPVPEHAMDVDA